MTIHKATASDAGCWVDGHWGQYGAARVINHAIAYGWEDAEASELAHKHLASMGPSTSPDLDSDEFGRMIDASDDAEAWLNENVAPEGYSFGWYDGEFFLWSDEQWQED